MSYTITPYQFVHQKGNALVYEYTETWQIKTNCMRQKTTFYVDIESSEVVNKKCKTFINDQKGIKDNVQLNYNRLPDILQKQLLMFPMREEIIINF